MNRSLAIFVLFGAATASCSSSSSGGGGPGAPTCDPGIARLDGTLSGSAGNQTIGVTDHFTSSQLQQVSQPSSLDVAGTLMSVHLEWKGLVANGSSAPATGTFLLIDGSNVTTYCVASGTIELRDKGAGWVLDQITSGTTCPGAAALTGTVTGCYGSKL